MYRNTYTLQDIAELSGCIKAFQEAHPTPAPYLSISIFTHWNDPALIQAMTDGLSKAFPRAAIAGLTTAGGIEDGQMNTGKTILSFMAFDESPVEVLHYNMKDLRAVEILKPSSRQCRALPGRYFSAPAIRCNLRRWRRHG